MSSPILGKCWHCGGDLKAEDYGRETTCLGCGKPTRVCRNCRWFAPDRTNECEEPVADRVMDKERANYCEFFEATINTSGLDGDSGEEDLLKAAEDLFKF